MFVMGASLAAAAGAEEGLTAELGPQVLKESLLYMIEKLTLNGFGKLL